MLADDHARRRPGDLTSQLFRAQLGGTGAFQDHLLLGPPLCVQHLARGNVPVPGITCRAGGPEFG
jgi:hypothetical protein